MEASIKYIIFVVLVILPRSLTLEGKDNALTRYKINDNEWKKAQNIINKLVDESIASRVTEAEKDMTSLLQQNIEDHIKAKSKEYVKDLKHGCKDKIEHCDTLAAAGVCKTSKKAMKENCAKTCSLCESQYIQISPEVEIVMKPKSKQVSFTEKAKAKVTTDVKAAALNNLFKSSSQSESSMEPLLSQQSSVAMKYHDNKDLTTENEKIKDAQKLLEYVKALNVKKKNKAVTHENAAKKHITKKPSKKSKTKKITGVPMDNLSKTVTYKNQKYKITPIVDWKKISKMLKSLGYKAIHIVGMKNKHLEKGLKDHLHKSGVTKVITGKKNKPHVAGETFVSAVHRQKSWHNKKWFKENCHPQCLVACIGSCAHGCCKEHDEVHTKTGLATHCHPMCKETCLVSCGSGCCSADEEKKRGHFLPNKGSTKPKPKITATKKVTNDKNEFRLSDIHHKEKPHPPIVDPKLFSPELYKPQPRLCPGRCSQACAPACTDLCCGFGEYARFDDQTLPGHKHNPGLVPNVPFPHKHGIPGNAYLCDEACKFHCDSQCPDSCCQPEGLVHRAARLQLPYYYNSQEQPVMNYQIPSFDQPAMCPAPCPSTCSPSCNPACCAAALGMPVNDQPDARSSTRKVIHIEHILHPLERKGMVPRQCPAICGAHCSPICARSGCCIK